MNENITTTTTSFYPKPPCYCEENVNAFDIESLFEIAAKDLLELSQLVYLNIKTWSDPFFARDS